MQQQKRNKKQQRKNAIARVDGNGNYYTDRIVPVMQQLVPKGTFEHFGTKAGILGGAALGARYGHPVQGAMAGGFIGGRLGNGVSRIVGFGDYTVQSNSIFKESMAVSPGEAVPSFGMIGQETRIRHREFIKDIVVPAVPATFTVQSFTINAGNINTFPWLATIAAQYQQYRVNGCVFEFKTLSSDITAGGALGSLILATNYDVTENAYPDKLRMENSQYAVSAKPSQSQIHTIECDPKLTQSKLLYVRDASSAASGVDARLSDLGSFQVATAGLPGTAGAVLGELWVSYDISLYKPEIVAPLLGGGQVSFTGSKTNLFGTAGASVKGLVITASLNTLTFAETGQYLVDLKLNGTTMVVPTFVGSTAAVVAIANSGFAAADTEAIAQYTVNVTAKNQTVVFDASGSNTVSVAYARVSNYTVAYA